MESLQMIPLDPIPLPLRVKWITRLSKSLQNREIQHCEVHARKVEHYCNVKRQKRISLGNGIHAFQYGSEILLEFDSPANHIAASVFCYSSLMERAFWICEDVSLETLKRGLDDIDELLSEKDEDLCEGTEHSKWETGFFQRQNDARAFLKVGKDEIKTSGLFSCLVCKSFDVDVEQKQCRSADEGMDVFISCNKCGKRSRIRG